MQNIQRKLEEQDLAELEAEKTGEHRYYAKEKEMAEKFDNFVTKFAKDKYKLETIPWLEISRYVVWVLLTLTMLAMLKRVCFLSLTVSAVAMMIITFPQNTKRNTFRQLVLVLVISLIYDILQLFIISPSASEEDEEDGGNEYKLNRFVRLVSFIALFVKIIAVLVFWKDSMDFRRIVKAHNNDEDEINDIMLQFRASERDPMGP